MNNKIWFKDKNVSIHYHSLIRYFIPMDIKNGLIQLYCDGRAANKCKELLIKYSPIIIVNSKIAFINFLSIKLH